MASRALAARRCTRSTRAAFHSTSQVSPQHIHAASSANAKCRLNMPVRTPASASAANASGATMVQAMMPRAELPAADGPSRTDTQPASPRSVNVARMTSAAITCAAAEGRSSSPKLASVGLLSSRPMREVATMKSPAPADAVTSHSAGRLCNGLNTSASPAVRQIRQVAKAIPPGNGPAKVGNS
jgi:hypothetical protein